MTTPLLRTAHWTVAVADPPMPGALHHWVLTPCVPVTDVLDLPSAAHADLFAVVTVMVGLNPGWCMAHRAGDPEDLSAWSTSWWATLTRGRRQGT